MEKRNDYNDRTPCRSERFGDKFCDCPSCATTRVKKAGSKQKSICDVDALSEKHNEQHNK